jgi:hypothetical protein
MQGALLSLKFEITRPSHIPEPYLRAYCLGTLGMPLSFAQPKCFTITAECRSLMPSSSTGAKHKLLLDETGFQQLLAAAYVLQQHNDALRAQAQQLDTTAVLPKVADTDSSDRAESTAFLDEVPSSPQPMPDPAPTTNCSGTTCRVCGCQFGKDEVFCGNCSMPRPAGSSSEDLQSKWASMWYMQQAQGTLQSEEVAPQVFTPKPDLAPAEFEPALNDSRLWAPSESVLAPENLGPENLGPENLGPENRELTSPPASRPLNEPEQSHTEIEPFSITEQTRAAAHSVEARPSEFLENLRDRLRTFQVRIRTGRKNAVVVIACLAILLIMAISALSPKHAPSQPQLSWFSFLLVNLGLVQGPTRAPAYVGNPDAPVWVDVHTALYYCKGSDLYGKTPGGRFSTQREAQEDQFESASRLACE